MATVSGTSINLASSASAVIPPAPAVKNAYGNSSVQLEAYGVGNLVWYTSSTGGTGSLTQPSVDFGATQGVHTFYVASRTADGVESARSALTLIYDGIAPTGTITAPTASPGASKLDFTVRFSEAVQNVDATDFMLSGLATGRISAITPVGFSNKDYTVTVSDISGSGQIQLGLASGSNIVDQAGNAATVAGPATYAIIPPAPAVKNAYGNSSVQLEAYGVGNLVWYTSSTGGTGSLTQPSLDFGATQGVHTFYVASRTADGVESDRSTLTLIYDGIAPTGTITAPSASPGASKLDFTVRFSEAVQNVDATDFMLSGLATGRISAITPVGFSNKDYTVTVSDISGFGQMQLGLASGSNIVDQAGNAAIITSSTVYAVIPPAPTTTNAYGNSSVQLDAHGVGDLVWYTSPTGGTGSLTQPDLDFGETEGAHTFYVASRTADGVESDRSALTLIYDGIAPTVTLNASSILT